MTTEGARFSPIDRRRFAQMSAGALALSAIGCRRGRNRALSTITVLYPSDELWYLPSQFLLFLPLVARNPKGEVEGRLPEAWSTRPTTERGPSICGLTSAGTTAFR